MIDPLEFGPAGNIPHVPEGMHGVVHVDGNGHPYIREELRHGFVLHRYFDDEGALRQRGALALPDGVISDETIAVVDAEDLLIG